MRIVLFCIFCLLPLRAHAIQDAPFDIYEQKYRGFLGLILSPKQLPHPINANRPNQTNLTALYNQKPVSDINESEKNIILCHDIQPYSHIDWATQMGRAARITANNAAHSIENIIIQPRYSGLRGPAISLIRADIEKTMRDNIGSPAEIFHNTKQVENISTVCKNRIKLDIDIKSRIKVDFFESEKAPLYRSDTIVNAHVQASRNFIGSLGIRVPFANNLVNDRDLLNFDRNDAIGQDEALFAEQGINIEHATLNAFFTPKPDLYANLQAGYLNERFLGFGGELLYRPYNRPWSIGFDLWGTARRASFESNGFNWDPHNKHISAFVNGHYDFQNRPFDIGLSLGRFIDGDYGGEMTVAYKPHSGWRLEGFARHSNEANRTLDNNTTHTEAGFRLTMPLEQSRGMPHNSHASFEFSPFGRDKRQRVENQYPLYTMTDPWSSANIYQHWNGVIE